MVKITVFPSKCASCFRYSTIIKEVKESKPEVGSSRISTEGLLISSKAIDNLFFYPPEIPLISCPPTRISKHFYSFNFFAKN